MACPKNNLVLWCGCVGQVLLYVMEFIVRTVLTPEVQKITRMDVKGVGMVFAGCVMASPSTTDMATMMYVMCSPPPLSGGIMCKGLMAKCACALLPYRKEITGQIRFVSNLLIAINPDLAAPHTISVAKALEEQQPLSSSPTSSLNLTKSKISSRVQLNILKKVKKAATAPPAEKRE